MKKIVFSHSILFMMVFALCLLTLSVSAQKETFDISTYTRPKGWVKEVKPDYRAFSVTNKAKNTFCKIIVYKSLPGSGSSYGNASYYKDQYNGKHTLTHWNLTLSNRKDGRTEAYHAHYEAVKGGEGLVAEAEFKFSHDWSRVEEVTVAAGIGAQWNLGAKDFGVEAGMSSKMFISFDVDKKNNELTFKDIGHKSEITLSGNTGSSQQEIKIAEVTLALNSGISSDGLISRLPVLR